MHRRIVSVLAIVAASVAAIAFGAAAPATVSAAPSAPSWAPAASAPIHPGTETVTDGGQCTANFVFTDGAGDVYLGQAAHCSSTGAQTDTDGCLAGSLPLGTEVVIDGATQPGIMVYNSWLAMQAAGETDPDVCDYNDLALIRIHPDDVARVNPSIPVWGGPTGIAPAQPALAPVLSFGNSSLRFGIEQLSPKYGVTLGTTGGGWTHPLYTLTPGIPGDSGSPFLDGQGRALGVLSTLAVLPTPLSNNVSDLASALAYANDNGPRTYTLVPGTEAFDGNPLNLVTSILGL